VDSEVEGQYLVVSSVSPHRNLTHQVFQRARVAHPIRDFVLSSNAQIFSVSSKRNTNGPVTEHYAEKVMYTTAEPFPSILRRSEIVEIDHVRLNAKETGLERIVRKTQEMAAVERKLVDKEDDNELAQLMVGAISISVLPESETSVARYRQLLPVADPEDEDEMEPELTEQENAIKFALIDHAIMIKRCLTSFSRSSNQILVKGHQDLYPCKWTGELFLRFHLLTVLQTSHLHLHQKSRYSHHLSHRRITALAHRRLGSDRHLQLTVDSPKDSYTPL
jgi:hypothetical protein